MAGVMRVKANLQGTSTAYAIFIANANKKMSYLENELCNGIIRLQISTSTSHTKAFFTSSHHSRDIYISKL